MMTAAKIKRIMESLGITDYANGVRIPKIRAIILTTTQAILPYRDVLTFDTDNELLKIKQYNHEIISDILNNGFLMYEKRLFWDKTPAAVSGRIPTTEDSLFVLNKNTGAVEKRYDIIASGKNFIDLDVIPDISPEKHILVIMKTKEYATAIRGIENKYIFLKLTPMTNHIYDMYLDMNQILGIEMNTPKLGSV